MVKADMKKMNLDVFGIRDSVEHAHLAWNDDAWRTVGGVLSSLSDMNIDMMARKNIGYGIHWQQLDEDILFERISRSGFKLSRVEVDALVGGYGYMSQNDWIFDSIVLGYGDACYDSWLVQVGNSKNNSLKLFSFDQLRLVPEGFDAAMLCLHSPPHDRKKQWMSDKKCSFLVFSAIVSRLVLLSSDHDSHVSNWAYQFVQPAIDIWRKWYLEGLFDC